MPSSASTGSSGPLRLLSFLVLLVLLAWSSRVGASTSPGIHAELRWITRSPSIARIEIRSGLPGGLRELEGAGVLRVTDATGTTTHDAAILDTGGDPPVHVSHLTLGFEPTTVSILDADGRVLGSGSVRIEPRAPDEALPPDWAKGMLWYQVFPERFANGILDNDPTRPSGTVVEWDRDFDDPTIEEIERAWFRASGNPGRYGVAPNRDGGAIASVVFQRRFGGDLHGVLDRLDHLQSLGVDGVYLCPIFDSGSLHKYDADDHRHIDPSLGGSGSPDPSPPLLEGDPLDRTTWAWTEPDRFFVDEFIPALEERSMRVMLDGVWNHVGLDHWAFRDVREKGSRSCFADWFDCAFDEHGALIAWHAWDGINGNLPIFKHVGQDLAPGPKAHVFEVTRRWMDPDNDGDPSDGIDGWRLDVANEIGKDFWRDWRALVREINPDALIVGEIWGDAQPWFDGDGFDAQMNYPAAYALADWLSIGSTRGDARIAADRLGAVFSHAPEHDQTQLNLMSSHDTERLVSLMENAWERGFDNGARPWSNDGRYDKERVTGDGAARAGAAIAALVAAPGSFMLYNGDEFALPGADDPDNRRPIPAWCFDEPERLAPAQRSMLGIVRDLSAVLHDPDFADVLRFGSARFSADAPGRTLVITRQLDDVVVTCEIGPAVVSEGSDDGRVVRLGVVGGDVTVTWNAVFRRAVLDRVSR